jgi:hypothetical protein
VCCENCGHVYRRVKFEFGSIKLLLVGWLVGPKNGQKPRKKFDFGGRQKCVVKDMDHFKSQCS